MPSKIHPARIILISILLATIVATIAGIAWFCINKQSFTGERTWVTPPEITGFSAKSLRLDSTLSPTELTFGKWKRYFLIAYNYQEKTGNSGGNGNFWFSTNGGFPQKSEMDDNIFTFLPKKRECYGHVIITNIFEFHSRQDFLQFTDGAISDKHTKKKNGCCDIFFSSPIKWDTLPMEPETPLLPQHRYYDGINPPVEYWPISDTIGARYLDSAWDQGQRGRRGNIDTAPQPGSMPWDISDSVRPSIFDKGRISTTPGILIPIERGDTIHIKRN